jgi:trk system potassium uptake protein TrkH
MQPILFITGLLLTTLGVMMVAPMGLDLLANDVNWQGFLMAAAMSLFFGLLLTLASRAHQTWQLSIRDTFLLTACSWISVAAFAALPFLFSHTTSSLVDALFEAVSGLTTTGATVIYNLNLASPGIVLWRSLLQWFGGIGIVVMALTVMPTLKIGGMQLFRNEFSDRSDKVLPRVSQIAGAILSTYVFFTILCALALWGAGMHGLDAICHALSTVSTGGFSTADGSIGAFKNPLIEGIIMLFMLLGSITLILFVRFFHGDTKALWKDYQVRAFFKVLILAIALITWYRWFHEGLPLEVILRESAFNATSILTTTGFSTSDYTLWGSFPLAGFFMLMMIGGCTGSTSGGIKVFRYQIMISVVKSYLYQMRRPHGVFLPLYQHKKIPEDIATSVFTFVGLYLFSLAGVTLALSFFDLDFVSALSAAVSSLSNTGPAFGPILGPMGTFAPASSGAKSVLMAAMLLGRLEFVTFYVMLLPKFWKV